MTTSSLHLSALVAIVALLNACDGATALSINIRTHNLHHAPTAHAPAIHRTTRPRAQFGNNQDTEPKGLSRDNEPEEFFSTNMDDMTDAEKIRSPGVIIGLAILIVPFIVGGIALSLAK